MTMVAYENQQGHCGRERKIGCFKFTFTVENPNNGQEGSEAGPPGQNVACSIQATYLNLLVINLRQTKPNSTRH